VRTVAIPPTPQRLADLVAEIQHSGEALLLTRDGKPAVRIEPASDRPGPRERLAALRDKLATGPAGWPDAAELRDWAQDGRG
jgi:antitoxin (DNA-binding transcriptional repressor) of toxin-antitoxin stability system